MTIINNHNLDDVSYAYDDDGYLAIHISGITVYSKYDNKGRMIAHHSMADNIITEHYITYNDDGNISYMKTVIGDKTLEEWFEYDEVDRLIHIKNNKAYEAWLKYADNGYLMDIKENGNPWKSHISHWKD